MEIVAGEGGKDSKLFVDELLSAYTKYVQTKGLQSDLIHSDFGHVVAKITGTGAAAAFQHEPGKHCVQRVPPTESKGRKQTSIVVVGILPIKEEAGRESLPESELEVTCQNGGGPGGQHQNKTASAVRMKHKPTGLSVFINGRDQHTNRREAKKILTAKVNELREQAANADYAEIRKAQLADSGRSNKIRTYNFLESRVVDHRLGTKTGNVKAIMRGEFDLLFR